MNSVKAMWCKLSKHGHVWAGAGYSSRTFDKEIPEDVIRTYWYCLRCDKRSYVDDPMEERRKRTQAYREKYGIPVLDVETGKYIKNPPPFNEDTSEFSCPPPSDGETTESYFRRKRMR